VTAAAGGLRTAARAGLRLTAALAAALVVPVIPVTALPAAAAAAVVDASPVQIELTGLTPTTLTPGATFTVTGTIRNVGSKPLGALHVDVLMRPERFSTRAAVDAWAGEPADERGGQRVMTVALRGRLAAGGRTTFRLQRSVDTFGLPDGSASFGPRGVTVEAFGTDDLPAATTTAARDARLPVRRLGLRRTFAVWSPDQAPPTTRVGIVVPLVATRASPDASAPDDETLAELSPTGRLGRLTRVAATTPGISWAVDPALLLAAVRANEPEPAGPTVFPGPAPSDAAGTTPAPTLGTPVETGPADGGTAGAGGTADGAGAQEWLTTVRGALTTQDVWALPFGDPDLAALGHGQQVDLLRAARTAADDATRRALGRTLPSTLGWPVDGLADRPAADLAARAGITDLVLAGAAQPSNGADGATPSARSGVTVAGGTVGGVVADDGLSETFGRAGRTQGVLAQQRLVADLAAVAREDLEGTGRSVVLAAPRDWRVDAADLARVLATLRTTPWLAITPVSTLRTEPATRTSARALSYPAAARSAELRQTPVRTIANARRRLAGFAPALKDPDPVVVPLQRESLSLVGTAWRPARTRMQARSTAFSRSVEQLYDGVGVPDGSSKLFAARTGNLPVTVENRLGVPVDVVVALRPRSGRLVVERPVTVTVPALGRTAALVPVRAIADGDVKIEVSLLTPDRVRIAESTPLTVRVRSDWESRGIAVVGGALVLLLLVGLVRGVRRGRRPSVPLDSVPDPDDVGRVLVPDDPAVEDGRRGPDTQPLDLPAPGDDPADLDDHPDHPDHPDRTAIDGLPAVEDRPEHRQGTR